MADKTREIRKLEPAELKRRIELNRNAKFGLEAASPAQLNIIYLLCRRWNLDPITDITLFQGQPWITVEGHLRLLRQHPDYRGFEQHPLTVEQKNSWGYGEADVVVETVIHTAKTGDISQRGVVFRAEIDQARAAAEQAGRRAAPLATHFVAIAEKRSLARAHRAAFGQDLPTEEEMLAEVEVEMARRTEVTEKDSAKYDQVVNEDYFEIPTKKLPEVKEPVLEVTDVSRETALDHLMQVAEEAKELGIQTRALKEDTPTNIIMEYADSLQAQIESAYLGQAAKV
jgi:hypothetical protein